MKTIKDILEEKDKVIWSVKPTTMVYDAICKMAERDIGALLVLDKGKLVGVVSERDYASKVILVGRTSVNTPVEDIMTSDVHSVSPDQDVETCMQLMTENHIRHLPVVDGSELIGVVSLGDLAKVIIAHQRSVIRELESIVSTKEVNAAPMTSVAPG